MSSAQSEVKCHAEMIPEELERARKSEARDSMRLVYMRLKGDDQPGKTCRDPWDIFGAVHRSPRCAGGGAEALQGEP